MTSSTGRAMPRPAVLVTAGGLVVFLASAAWLVATGNSAVRYSADSAETVEMWRRWAPALAGIAAVRLLPLTGRPAVVGPSSTPAARHEALALAALAAGFAVGLVLVGGGEPAHTLGKLALLVAVPLALLRTRRRRGTAWRAAVTGSARWRAIGPAIAVTVWGLLAFASPLAVPGSDYADTVSPVELVATIAVGFVINAMVEEAFYRRWLLSRAQAWLGVWPAIVVSSLLWSLWHVAIQGTGDLDVDVASAIVTHALTGVFLGYLWIRYRLMWPLLAVHGALNAVGLFTGP